MGESGSDPWGRDWAAKKLDMPRRRRDLEQHIAAWLPELRTMPKGLVIDLGAGPGDFLALCRDMGHDVLGIDAPEGRGGMGDAYLAIAREERQRLGVRVDEMGALRWIDLMLAGDVPREAVCVHSRGAVEQMLAVAMTGEPHDAHHECKRLDWDADKSPEHFRRLMLACAKVLRPGGLCLIAANGTRSTDVFYEAAIQKAAAAAGLRLISHKPPTVHKWIMPE